MLTAREHKQSTASRREYQRNLMRQRRSKQPEKIDGSVLAKNPSNLLKTQVVKNTRFSTYGENHMPVLTIWANIRVTP